MKLTLGTGIFLLAMEPSPCQKLDDMYSDKSTVTKQHKMGAGHKHP